jgi:uncharacterized protein (TIGR00369 family)
METNAAQQSLVELIIEKYLGKPVTDGRSAAGNWLGFTLEAISKGTVTISLPVKREMTNPYGHIHGGMMSLVIDEVIGWAVVSLESEHHYTSLNLNVDFLYAIKEGDRLVATAKIVRAGKKIVHAECEVKNEDGTLLAKAASNLVVTGMKMM